jgi:hypothetical protein
MDSPENEDRSPAVRTNCNGEYRLSPTRVTCYVQVATNQVVYEGNKRDHLNLSLSESKAIKAKISHISAKVFSYMITDSSYTTILKSENLLPDDGLLDSSEENFTIPFPPV